MSDAITQDLDRRLRASSGGDIGVANALTQAITRQGGNPSQSPTLRLSFDYARRRVNAGTALDNEKDLLNHALLECTGLLCYAPFKPMNLHLQSKEGVELDWDTFIEAGRKPQSSVICPTYAGGKFHFLYADKEGLLRRVSIAMDGSVNETHTGADTRHPAYMVSLPDRGEAGLVFSREESGGARSQYVEGVDSRERVIENWPASEGSIAAIKEGYVIVREQRALEPGGRILHFIRAVSADRQYRLHRFPGFDFAEEGEVFTGNDQDGYQELWPHPNAYLRSIGAAIRPCNHDMMDQEHTIPSCFRSRTSIDNNRVDNELFLTRKVEAISAVMQEVPYAMMRAIVKAYNYRRPDDPKTI